MTFKKELQTLINKYYLENTSNTPDFLLADYLNDTLNTFDKLMARRDLLRTKKVRRVIEKDVEDNHTSDLIDDL